MWVICILPRPCLEGQVLLFISQVAGTLFKIGYFSLRLVTTLITVLYLCIWYGHSHADHILILTFTFVSPKAAFKIQFIILTCNLCNRYPYPFSITSIIPKSISNQSPISHKPTHYGHYFIDNISCANIHHILNFCLFL